MKRFPKMVRRPTPDDIVSAANPAASTYGDETSSGQTSASFRGLGRATIGARVDDRGGFEWLPRFSRDFLPESVEPKSHLVLAVMDANSAARDEILDAIGPAAILIVDLGEHYRELLTSVFERFGKPPPSRTEAIDFIGKQEEHRSLSETILGFARESAVYATGIPKIEAMLRDVVAMSLAPQGKAEVLIDREALRELNQQSFHELITRFSMAFADVLAPERQARAIAAAIEQQRFLTPGLISFVTLGEAIVAHRVFDLGDPNAFRLLTKAHDDVLSQLQAARSQFLVDTIRGGRVVQEDSKHVLGLQVADIAARVASREYEKHPDDRLAGARATRNFFDHVFLNDRWL